MSAKVRSILNIANTGSIIDVECHISNGLPSIIIVGFANKAIDEAKERVRSAFANAKLDLPRKRITINLAPADLPKDSTNFDVPIALAILAASKQINEGRLKDAICIGELGLDGSIRAVRGVIGILLAGQKKGFKKFYIPADNLSQAKLVPNITLIPVRKLRDLYLDLTGTVRLPNIVSGYEEVKVSPVQAYPYDFKDIAGQARAKRALEIAAAGGHNILLNGPPGTGKSMLAKATPSILPPMNFDEILETTQLHSLIHKDFNQIVTERPFRAPHHSASEVSITGGGQYPRPGEISLSHHGVLFFDEFAEFSKAAIEALRQPLEDRTITVARARDNVTFPANFMLIATSNPCPCGYYGTSKVCECLPHQINKYRRKLSGPILDRIDLYVDVGEVKHDTLLHVEKEESSKSVQQRVRHARELQRKRYGQPLKYNATLTNKDIKRYVPLELAAEELLNQAAERLSISARSYMRVIKVARTIADLDGSENIGAGHIGEALQYRPVEKDMF